MLSRSQTQHQGSFPTVWTRSQLPPVRCPRQAQFGAKHVWVIPCDSYFNTMVIGGLEPSWCGQTAAVMGADRMLRVFCAIVTHGHNKHAA